MSTQTKRIAFHTLGCKLNFSETSTISRDLTNSGFEKVKTDQHLFDEETGIQYGQNLTQTWEPKEK